MSNSKFYVNLDTTERNLLLTCLNDLRNDLLSKGRHTDAVDDKIGVRNRRGNIVSVLGNAVGRQVEIDGG